MAVSYSVFYLTVIFGICHGFTGKTAVLSDGNKMPVVGLGTFLTPPEKMDNIIFAALNSGYRHIDTAFYYQNEKSIGDSLKKWFARGGKREDLYITTKLPITALHPSDVPTVLEVSLKNLGIDYIDMYLIHAPFALKRKPDFSIVQDEEGYVDLDLSVDYTETWKELEKHVQAGKIRSIGLSNFNETQLLKIWKKAEIKPTNLQIEINPYIQQEELVKLCHKLNIVVTAYSPIGSGSGGGHVMKRETKNLPSLLKHPVVQKIAEKYNKSPAQVVMRHTLQRNIVVIPKSTNPKRINENIDLFDFELSNSEMNQLKALDQHGKYRKYDFLSFKGIYKHPEYPFSDKIPK